MVTVYDFDGTLYRGNSFIDFARSSLSPLRLAAGSIAALPWIVAWKMGLVTSSRAKEKLWCRWFRGMVSGDYHQACQRFTVVIDARLKQEVYDSMLDSLTKPGNRTYIISASLGWVNAWASRHPGITVINTRPAIVDSILTGRFDGPNCLGNRKVELLLLHEKINDANPLILYTDSQADAPLMKIATETHLIR